MVLFRFLNFIAGYTDVSCDACCASEAINLMMKNEIDYWSMKRACGGELTFSILNSEYRKLKILASESSCCFKTGKKHGLPYIIGKYKKRVGIPVGILLFILCMKLSTMYVWEISVSGNENISDAEITESLEALGFAVGSYIPKVDFYSICHEFILQNDDVSWISVNMVGTTAQVEIIERNKKGDIEDEGNGTPTNLVASRDGVIVRTETYSGKTVVKSGEKVQKGQLLVSGIVEIGRNDDGRFTLMRSSAEIFAETDRVFEITVPLKSVKKTYIGRKEVSKSINIFGNPIKLKENSSILPQDCDIIKDKRRIVLFEGGKITGGIALPISVVTEYYDEYSEEECLLTEEAALVMATLRLTDAFAKELADAEIITRQISHELIETGDGPALVLTCGVHCIENIAYEVPIGVS